MPDEIGEDEEVIKHLVALLVEELDARPEQVLIYNQKFKLPKVSDWFITVKVMMDRQFARSKKYKDVPTTPTDGLHSMQTMNVRTTFALRLFSASNIARKMRNNVYFALTGDAAERSQSGHAFRIANLPSSFIDVSEVEGTARLNAYEIMFNVLSASSRERPVPFYDKFTIPPQILVNP